MPELVLDARALEKRYKSVHAVRGIDVTVAPGERLGLLGPNGAGKTTTLLMLLGVVRPDAGSITIAGHRLPRGRSKAMGRVGFAAGYLPLPERLRVREALAVFAGWYGVRDVGPAVDRGLERFGIPHLADRMASELSSGQRTLVGIVKATLHEPDLLVLDEPTASLDPAATKAVEDIIAAAAAGGVKVVMATHDLGQARRLAGDIAFLARGRLMEHAPAERFFATPATPEARSFLAGELVI
jgi:ABC-2 type transport system ATP-binding protein